ncbi:MAG TPA: SgcJ/EcaC family oxidoreductase [Polyangia bacterium]
MAPDSADETAIRTLIETWHRATEARDVVRVLQLIAEDAVFLTPDSLPMRGRAVFAQALHDVLKTHNIRSSGEIREVKVSGDLAYCWTDLIVTMAPLDGTSPKVRRGPSLSILRKESDGAWALIRDANMLASDSEELALKVDNLERELMADGPGG